MVISYEEIYSQFYGEIDDPKFFTSYTESEAHELMRGWLRTASTLPYLRKCFNKLQLDDVVEELTCEMDCGIDESSDINFTIEIFAKGMVISWMKKELDSRLSLARVIGGKEERNIQNNYKENKARLKELQVELQKYIRDYGYENNSYI